MKTEKEYVESYDKRGCLAIIFGMLVAALALSICLNLVMWIKLTTNQ